MQLSILLFPSFYLETAEKSKPSLTEKTERLFVFYSFSVLTSSILFDVPLIRLEVAAFAKLKGGEKEAKFEALVYSI